MSKWIDKVISFKVWLFGLGVPTLAIVLWWIIKSLICLLTGVCLI
jgi:hypothetical protein